MTPLKDYYASGVYHGSANGRYAQFNAIMRASSMKVMADAIPNCSLYALRQSCSALRNHPHSEALDKHPPGTLLVRGVSDWNGEWVVPDA